MAIRDIAPWNWGRKDVGIRRESTEHPIVTLQRAMNRLFDDFFRDFDITPFGRLEESLDIFSPNIDLREDDKEFRVTAELPGMDENDIEIHLSNDALTIKGEKKEEKEEKEKDCYYRERAFGSFQRVISLPGEIDADKAEAKFKKGVLYVTIPKMARAQRETKKIKVKTE